MDSAPVLAFVFVSLLLLVLMVRKAAGELQTLEAVSKARECASCFLVKAPPGVKEPESSAGDCLHVSDDASLFSFFDDEGTQRVYVELECVAQQV